MVPPLANKGGKDFLFASSCNGSLKKMSKTRFIGGLSIFLLDQPLQLKKLDKFGAHKSFFEP